MIVDLTQVKAYLRVDSMDEDELITALLTTAQEVVSDVARLSEEDMNTLMTMSFDDTSITVSIRGETLNFSQALAWNKLLNTAVLYTVGYLYENREQADHHDMMLTLRCLLGSIREVIV